MRITVGLAQIYPKLGDVAANVEKHLAFVEQADKQGVDLLVFPELSTTGYQVQDLVPEVAIRPTRDDDTFPRPAGCQYADGHQLRLCPRR